MELRSNGSLRLQERSGLNIFRMSPEQRRRGASCADRIDLTTEPNNGDWRLDRDRLRFELPTPVGNHEVALFYRIDGSKLETASDAGFRDDVEHFRRETGTPIATPRVPQQRSASPAAGLRP
jgi:hypothetical protein